MTRSTLHTALALILTGTLAAGSLALAQSVQSTTPPAATAPAHTPNPHQQALRISRELNLTADQTAKLEPILADRDQKLAALRSNSSLAPADARKQMRAIRQNTQSQLSTVLTPGQIQQFRTIQRSHAHRGQAQPAAAPTA